MGQSVRAAIAAVFGVVTVTSVASAQTDPPGRIGRLAYTNGTVSFHDAEETQWAPAAINTPLTTGDAIWTEPNSHSEVSIAGTRVRMDASTELDMVAVDDNQVRMEVPQGRLDIKAAAMDKPYQVVTPRGTVVLQQAGDYYIESGSTQDATRLGVRTGAAQITDLNGQTLAVRAGEVGEITGDSGAPVLHTVQSAPPPMQPYWADRDRQVSYDPPQYLSASVTGYEDLNANGGWSNNGTYGEVWTPNNVPAGWQPYHNGHWSYVQPWGWTWVDEQPWGFAPFHYGRWVNANNRWSWLPPGRQTQAVYAPALVSFIGATAELLLASSQPSVGWFPLGPREVYVPSYTTNRDYFRNVNRPYVTNQALVDERFQQAQQHRGEAQANDPRFTHVNQRFATVVPQEAFQRSQPTERAAIKVDAQKLTAAPIALVAAPPVANRAAAPGARGPDSKAAEVKPGQPKPGEVKPGENRPGENRPGENRPGENRPNTAAAPAKGSVAHTAFANMETVGRPTTSDQHAAPGPKVVKRADTKPETGPIKANEAPPLVPRTGATPPALKNEATATPAKPEAAPKPGEPAARPEAPRPPTANEAKGAPAPGPAIKPIEPNAKPEPPRPPAAENKAAPPAGENKAAPPAGENKAAPPAGENKAAPPARPAEPPRAAAEPPHPAAAPAPAHPAAEPPRAAAEPPHPAAAPAPARPVAEPPRAAAEPPHPAAAPARPAAEPPHPAAAPQQQVHAPEPPHQAPPPPQQQVHAPEPPHQAPPPQQAHAPEPPHQQAPPPQAPHPQAPGPAPKEEKK